MENSNSKLNFKPIELAPVDLIKDKLVSFDVIQDIFQGMAFYLGKYFDLSQDEILTCIVQSAYNWQENYKTTFEIYSDAILQEKLILADQMKKEVIITFSLFLKNPSDMTKLESIAEKSLLFYMNEYT